MEPRRIARAEGRARFCGRSRCAGASSGVSALVACIVLGPRAGHGKNPVSPPSNVGYVFIGAALLWVGWFGFNAGSAVAANGLASSAFMVTHVATAMAALTWLILEWIIMKKPSVIGACTGAVAGLVAITPASGFVNVGGALAIGTAVSLISFTFMSVFRKMFKYDDALDVFSVHGLGGHGALSRQEFSLFRRLIPQEKASSTVIRARF